MEFKSIKDILDSDLNDVMNDIVGRYVLYYRPEYIVEKLSLEDLIRTLQLYIRKLRISHLNYNFNGILYLLESKKTITHKSNIYEILKSNPTLVKAYKKIMFDTCGSVIYKDKFEDIKLYEFSFKHPSPWSFIYINENIFRVNCSCTKIYKCGICHYLMH